MRFPLRFPSFRRARTLLEGPRTRCTRTVLLAGPHGRRRRYPLPEGCEPQLTYVLDGETWTLLLVVTDSAPVPEAPVA